MTSFGDLRSVLQRNASHEQFERVCQTILSGWRQDQKEFQVWIDYTRESLKSWPDNFRRIPDFVLEDIWSPAQWIDSMLSLCIDPKLDFIKSRRSCDTSTSMGWRTFDGFSPELNVAMAPTRTLEIEHGTIQYMHYWTEQDQILLVTTNAYLYQLRALDLALISALDQFTTTFRQANQASSCSKSSLVPITTKRRDAWQLKVYDMQTQTLKYTQSRSHFSMAQITTDGQYLLLFENENIHIHDAQTGQFCFTTHIKNQEDERHCLHGDGRTITQFQNNRWFVYHSVQDHKLLDSKAWFMDDNDMHFWSYMAPNNRQMAVSSFTETVYLIDLETTKRLGAIYPFEPEQAVYDVAIAKYHPLMAILYIDEATSFNLTCVLCNLNTQETLGFFQLEFERAECTHVIFGPDDTTLYMTCGRQLHAFDLARFCDQTTKPK